MFFLMRSAFWLGLTFSQMPWPQGGPAPVLPAAASIGATMAGKACAALPHDCLAAASLARGR